MFTPKFRKASGLSVAEFGIIIVVIVVVLGMAIPAITLRRNVEARHGAVEAVREGDVSTLERALNWRTSPNEEFFEEWILPDGAVLLMHYSLLSYAVKHEQEAVVRLLIEYGADVDGQVWGSDRPPLFWAAYTANERIFDVLIEAGADIDALVVGKTALGYAKDGHEEAAAFLTERGAK